MSIEEFEFLSLTIGIGALVLYMLYIIYRLAKDSNAGRFGSMILFFVLGLGFVGLLAKSVLVEILL
ncbi:MAG: hypothetical protein BMS9Abin26_0813 [Gammaproteobacteria bacterium]|nr:MAG: hypothetical protein BMS9Abin26_0813 [Gammaproteobacteria bacterium]